MKHSIDISSGSLKMLFVKLLRMFYGPALVSTFRSMDPVFREKILLTVSISNTCGG